MKIECLKIYLSGFRNMFEDDCGNILSWGRGWEYTNLDGDWSPRMFRCRINVSDDWLRIISFTSFFSKVF